MNFFWYWTEIGSFLACEDPGTLEESDWDSGEMDPITPETVGSLLKEVSPYKSSGCTNINTRVYLCAFSVLTEQLAFLFNLTVNTSCFLSDWKRGPVTPIPKKGALSCLDNWRPISITHLCGKLMEEYVSKFISDYLEEFIIISDRQMGF